MQRRSIPLLYAVLIFAINVYVCWNLFFVEYSVNMGSIESSFMSISRWAVNHWDDLSWFPSWFNGMPFHHTYVPGLHLTVAGLATWTGWSVPHAYHVVVALAYVAGALTLYLLCYAGSRDSLWALVTALLYSLVSPALFFSSALRSDTPGWFSARRFQVLVQYGEGPHLSAMVLLPVVILTLYLGAVEKRRWAMFAAPFALAGVALTNWVGLFGVALAVLAFLLSFAGSLRWRDLLRMAGVAVAAYLMLWPWVPPDVAGQTVGNTSRMGPEFDMTRGGAFLVVAAGGAILLAAFWRWRVNHWLRFFAMFTYLTGAVTMGYLWFDWRLMLQAHRWQLEFEMAFCGLAAYVAVWTWRKLPRSVALVVAGAAGVLVLVQTGNYAREARARSEPGDMEGRIEWRMARWFEANLPGQRVFAPGNTGYWLDTLSDVPQMAGCCDQSVSTPLYLHTVYGIYHGKSMGEHPAEVTKWWLQAYGVDAIMVTGPGSADPYSYYYDDATVYDGHLPELLRQDGNVVYKVPRKSASLARVVPREALLTHPPADFLDVAELGPWAAALEDPALPEASFRWVNAHEAEVEATAEAGQVVAVLVSYDRDWRAFEGDREVAVRAEGMGMLFVEPDHAGPVRLRLVYEGGPYRWSWVWLAFAGGVLLAGALAKVGSI